MVPLANTGRGMGTPWGAADEVLALAPGVLFAVAAEGAGFRLTGTAATAVEPHHRTSDGWYDERDEAHAVARAFPNLFTPQEHARFDVWAPCLDVPMAA